MRYLHPTFLESTLRRGKSVEQFMGGRQRDGDWLVYWIEIRPEGNFFEVWQLEALDVGDKEHVDIYAIMNGNIESPVAAMREPRLALAYAQSQLGASEIRWVNETVSQDEYKDFIIAGRPPKWPIDA